MKIRIVVTAVVMCALGAGGSAGAVTSPNLLVNPAAEAGAGSPNGSVVAVPGWKTSGKFTVLRWDGTCPGGCPTPAEYAGGQTNFFAGGPSSALSQASQDVSVAKYAAAVDRGTQNVLLSAALGGWAGQHDTAGVQVVFLSAVGRSLGNFAIGGDTYSARAGATAFVNASHRAAVPKGTRTIRVTMIARRAAGDFDDGYFDNLVLRLG